MINGSGTPNGFKTQTKSYGWSCLLLKNLHAKFQVIPTSFDPVSASDGKSAALRDKVFGFFRKIGNFANQIARILIRFSTGKSSQKVCKSVKKNIRRRKKLKNRKTDSKRAQTGENPPRVAGPCDPGPRSPATMEPGDPFSPRKPPFSAVFHDSKFLTPSTS